MKNQNEGSRDNRRYFLVLLGCVALVVAVGAMFWQPQFADTETLSKYEYDTDEDIISASDAVDDVPTEDDSGELTDDYSYTIDDDDNDDAEDVEEADDEDVSDDTASEDTAETSSADDSVPKESVKFVLPMTKARVSRAYSVDTLSYDETMEDWRVHAATDYSGETGDAVKAVSDGTVIETGENVLYGKYIVINHAGDIQSKYAGIDGICVAEGDSVTVGQQLAELGEPMPAEAKQGVHLHLEVVQKKNSINLEDLLN